MDKGKRTIREGETSQWIREKGQSEKERHHNGGKKYYKGSTKHYTEN